MQRPQNNVIVGFLLVCALGLTLVFTPTLRWLDDALYDAQVRWLQKHAASTLVKDVVVIGLDESALETLAEPMGLWHRHLGLLLQGLTQARPSVVGIAAPLPVRSYDFLVKGIDKPLLEGIERLQSVAPLVVGQAKGEGLHLELQFSTSLRKAATYARSASANFPLHKTSNTFNRRIPPHQGSHCLRRQHASIQ